MTNTSGTVRVTSKRKGGYSARPDETVVPADRRSALLGNRHILHNHHDAGERARVIEAHGRDLDADLAADGPISQTLTALARRVVRGEHIALECWCAPRPCHADRYARIIADRAAAISKQA